MTYEGAINELAEMLMHIDTLYELGLYDMWGEFMHDYRDRANELWLELGGYKLCGDDIVLRSAAHREVARRRNEFESRPTVYRFTKLGGSIDKWDCDYLWERDCKRRFHDECNEYEPSYMDELEAVYA